MKHHEGPPYRSQREQEAIEQTSFCPDCLRYCTGPHPRGDAPAESDIFPRVP